MLCVKLEFTSLAIGLVFGIFELNKWGGVGGGGSRLLKEFFSQNMYFDFLLSFWSIPLLD